MATASVRAEQDLILFARLHDPDDPVTRDVVVERFLPLARSVARAHCANPETFDDVFQVACFGLLKAVERFDPDRSLAFSSFAVPTMTGEIKRYFRDRTWSVRPPRQIQETFVKVNRVVEAWTARHGRAPSPVDVAHALDLELEDVLEAMQAGGARTAMSLDGPAGPGDEREDASVGDLLAGADDTGFERVEETALLESLLRHLPDRDRRILEMRFGHDMTQAEIGEVIALADAGVAHPARIAAAVAHSRPRPARVTARGGVPDSGGEPSPAWVRGARPAGGIARSHRTTE